jgi:hypothetical protein
MNKILIGTAIGLFAVVPAMSSAHCGDEHSTEAMASASPASKSEQVQAPSAAKAPVRVATKAPAAKQVKHAAEKPASPTKTDGSTVLAKTN